MTSASSDDGSLTSCGAISAPTANPTAATHSQKSFRPKNKIATPMSTPTIVTEECIGKTADFDNYSVEGFVPNAFLPRCLTQAPLHLHLLFKSGWWDLNPRPPGPEPGALPS